MSQQDSQHATSDVEQSISDRDSIEPLSDDELEDVAGGWDGPAPPPPGGG